MTATETGLSLLALVASGPLLGGSVLDDLLPQPARVERRESVSVPDAARLSRVRVVNGTVPDAPAVTADESYVLEVTSSNVTIVTSGPRGENWARGTLAQLRRLAASDEAVPCCRIVDWPHLKWRGFMLDTSRNYLPVASLKDVLDAMALYKLNLFHWHLTEDYAWRLESKRYPQLHADGAFTLRHPGKYYAQDEFRDVVSYARERGIAVMPEFDVPGHAHALRKAFGFKTMRDPGVDRVVADLLGELCSLVPREQMPFVHIGTDEVFDRSLEGVTRETLNLWAKTVSDAGRTVVSWVPGEDYDAAGPRVNMFWTRDVDTVKHPGPYFDAYSMYIEDPDPFELITRAVYWRAASRWEEPGRNNLGALFCAWHDGFVGLPYENLLRNQQVAPCCAMFGDAFWHGRERHLPQYRKRLPAADDPNLTIAAELERRMAVHRDRLFASARLPFQFLRQTDMRWRLSQADGRLIARNIAQATIVPGREGNPQFNYVSISNGPVVAETWIRSPKTQDVGAWIGFTGMTRDHGMVYAAPLPDRGEWNRFGAFAEINGERIDPPKWKRPGLCRGKETGVFGSAWRHYEIDEEPFADQEYFMREPTAIRLREGWNHVRLFIPNPGRGAKGTGQDPRWIATFIPLTGTTDHPREVEGLVYSCDPQPTGGRVLTVAPTSTNMTPFVTSAVAGLGNGDTLVFEPGEYHFYEEGSVRRHVELINGMASCGMKNVVFALDGLDQVTIDGRDARFVWHGNVFPFAMTSCTNVTVGNFTANAFRPGYAECEITAFHDDGFTLRFRDPSAVRLTAGGGLAFDTDIGLYDSREKILTIHALNRFKIRFLFVGNEKSRRDALPTKFMNCRAEQVGEGVYRLRNRHQDINGCIDRLPLEVGEPLALNLNLRERCSLLLDKSRNMRVENVRIEAGDGMGLCCYRTENLTVDGLRVVPVEGSRVSTTADGIMLINVRGQVEIVNSEVAWTMDDAVNVHGNYLRVVSAVGRKVSLETIHAEQWRFHPYHVGDEVEFSNPRTHDVLFSANVVDVVQTEHGADIVIDRDVPDCPKGTLVEDCTWIPDVRIANCHFHDTLHLRLSGRGKWLVEENRMARGAGVLINDLGGYWGEAGRTADMTIRHNFFDDFTARVVGKPVIQAEVEGRGKSEVRVHRGIRILENRHRGANGAFVDLPCAVDPVVRGNICLE